MDIRINDLPNHVGAEKKDGGKIKVANYMHWYTWLCLFTAAKPASELLLT